MPPSGDSEGLQKALAMTCRDGVMRDIEGSRPDRIPQYRRLIFKIVSDALTKAYPITSGILDNHWPTLVHRFFDEFPCSSPSLWKMPRELISYVQNKSSEYLTDYPWLLDLLRFEWIEIEVYMMEDEPLSYDPSTITVNPHFRLLQLLYPVHRVPIKEIEPSPHPIALVCWRSTQDLKVSYAELTFESALLLAILEHNNGQKASDIECELRDGLADYGASLDPCLVLNKALGEIQGLGLLMNS